MKERIIEIMENKGVTAAKLAELLNIQRSGLSHILSGRNRPGLEFIERLLRLYPDINSLWLILGEGMPFMGSSSDTEKNVGLFNDNADSSETGTRQNILTLTMQDKPQNSPARLFQDTPVVQNSQDTQPARQFDAPKGVVSPNDGRLFDFDIDGDANNTSEALDEDNYSQDSCYNQSRSQSRGLNQAGEDDLSHNERREDSRNDNNIEGDILHHILSSLPDNERELLSSIKYDKMSRDNCDYKSKQRAGQASCAQYIQSDKSRRDTNVNTTDLERIMLIYSDGTFDTYIPRRKR